MWEMFSKIVLGRDLVTLTFWKKSKECLEIVSVAWNHFHKHPHLKCCNYKDRITAILLESLDLFLNWQVLLVFSDPPVDKGTALKVSVCLSEWLLLTHITGQAIIAFLFLSICPKCCYSMFQNSWFSFIYSSLTWSPSRSCWGASIHMPPDTLQMCKLILRLKYLLNLSYLMSAKVCSSFSGQFSHTVLQCFAWPVMFGYTSLANRTWAGAQNSLKPKQQY